MHNKFSSKNTEPTRRKIAQQLSQHDGADVNAEAHDSLIANRMFSGGGVRPQRLACRAEAMAAVKMLMTIAVFALSNTDSCPTRIATPRPHLS